jgi:23S rRNA pseudouridine2605 synthase
VDSGSPRPSLNKPVRLQKYLAACGVASRRACELFIADGRVTVNGRPVVQQGLCINPETDVVEMDGQRVFPERKLYFMLNKPVGFLCTCADTHGRRTFMDFFPGVQERLYPVGRLDQDSAGLLIVTNDGDLALRLTHPRHEVAKTYHVRLDAPLSAEARRRMLDGVESDGEVLRAESITAIQSSQRQGAAPALNEYQFILKEGRKRQIRRMVANVGLEVFALRRVAVGSLILGALPEGKARALSSREVETLFREAGMGTAPGGAGSSSPKAEVRRGRST